MWQITSIILLLAVTMQIAKSEALSEKLCDYFFVTKNYPTWLTQTVKLAEQEQDQVELIMKEVPGAILFLPTDDAWKAQEKWFDALMSEPDGTVRYDVLLAASADASAEEVGSGWNALQKYAEVNGGVLDSAYGTTYIVKESDNDGGGLLCLAEWNEDGGYTEGECANVRAPIELEDATIYPIEKLLLPAALHQEMEELSEKK